MNTLITVAQILIGLAATGAVGAAFVWARQKIGTERLKKINQELQHNQDLAKKAVKYVEEKFKEIHGPEKLKAAIDWASKVLTKKGIKISEIELEGLILSALREIKDAFGEEWAHATSEDDSQS